MMYDRSVSHCCRCAILFIVDCSLSMKNFTRFSNTIKSKIEVAAIIVNHFIDELVARATRNAYTRDYYDIGVIGYSGYEAVSLLTCDDRRIFVRVPQLAEALPQPKSIYLNQQLHDGRMISVPMNIHPWIEPAAAGASPMYEAMVMAKTALREWCDDPANRFGHAPMVFHITDGTCSDADDLEIVSLAEEIKELEHRGDKVMLFNVYLATTDEGDESEDIYPREEMFATADRDREFIYRLSSTLPHRLERCVAELLEPHSSGPYRATAFNISPLSMLSLIKIGTQQEALQRPDQ